MKKNIKLILLLALCAMPLTMFSQGSTISPYSRMGYGILSDNSSGIQRSMGGVGYAMQNGRQINVKNPASYAAVDSLTFLWDIGMDLSNLWSEENGKHGYSFAGGLDYITSEFRIAKNLGGSFGIVPFSSVGYTFGTTLDNGSETRAGTGGLAELYVGAGYRPFKGFSVGANVSYLFGTLANDTYVYGASTSIFERVMEVRDWNLHIGAQYAFSLGEKNKMVLGVTYSPKKSLHGHAWGVYYDVSQDSKADTVGYASMKNRYELPHTFGAGLSYTYDDRLTGEVDFTYQNWSDSKYNVIEGIEASNMTLNDRWKVAAGLSYTPSIRGNYLQRMTYRVGGHFNHDYMNILGNNVRDYGVSLGFTFPAPNTKTLVNLGVEWLHRYTAPNNLIKEDYLNITLSVNFNELWFWKNKIR